MRLAAADANARASARGSGGSTLFASPHFPYVAPLVFFFLLQGLAGWMRPLGAWEFPLRVVLLGAFTWWASRKVLAFRVANWLGSIALGVAVFALWIAPETLFPGWRQHWLFSNSLTGSVSNLIPAGLETDLLVLISRTVRAAVLVPVIEELFWRGWLMRWLIRPDFETVPLGAYDKRAFWITALLFAAEHGAYWEVGLLTGIIYNWWMVRTKSLGDLILVHGVTNLTLSLYVIATKQWHYWL